MGNGPDFFKNKKIATKVRKTIPNPIHPNQTKLNQIDLDNPW